MRAIEYRLHLLVRVTGTQAGYQRCIHCGWWSGWWGWVYIASSDPRDAILCPVGEWE